MTATWGCAKPVDSPAGAPGNSSSVDRSEAAEIGSGESAPQRQAASDVVGQRTGQGLIRQPANAVFNATDRLRLRMVDRALQLYKAGPGQGEGPPTHEAFMRDVIVANRIELPELPEGQSYVYDPASEQLLVEFAE